MSVSIYLALRTALGPVLRWGFRLGCAIIKPKPRRIVFTSYPDAADNSWHLYCYMAKELSGYEFIWLCKHPERVRERIVGKLGAQSRNSVRVCSGLSLMGHYQIFRSKTIFVTHGLFAHSTCTPHRRIVNLWHGMPVKRVGYLDPKNKYPIRKCDCALSTSALYTEIMAKVLGIKESQVLEIGLPRNDALHMSTDSLAYHDIRAKLGVSGSQRLVFWLPTYRRAAGSETRDDSSISSFLDEWPETLLHDLSVAAEAAGVVMVIKLHPLDCLNKGRVALGINENIRIYTSGEWMGSGMDLYDALGTSDALVTDLSSVLVDYLETGKPIGITVSSGANYDRGLIDGVSEVLNVGFPIRSIEDMRQFMEVAKWVNIESHADGRERYNALSGPGACKRVMREFIE